MVGVMQVDKVQNEFLSILRPGKNSTVPSASLRTWSRLPVRRSLSSTSRTLLGATSRYTSTLTSGGHTSGPAPVTSTGLVTQSSETHRGSLVTIPPDWVTVRITTGHGRG